MKKKKPTPFYFVKAVSNYSRFLEPKICKDIKKVDPHFNLILPDFTLNFKKKPFGLLDEKTLAQIKEQDGYYFSSKLTKYNDGELQIITNQKSFTESCFWDEIEVGYYPYDLFQGTLGALTTLKPREFKKMFEKKCEGYLNKYWKTKYRECIIGDFDSLYECFDTKTGKTVKKKHPPLDLSSKSDWDPKSKTRTSYIKGNRNFFKPKISLNLI